MGRLQESNSLTVGTWFGFMGRLVMHFLINFPALCLMPDQEGSTLLDGVMAH